MAVAARAAMDDLGYISIILFQEGDYSRPIGVLNTYEWSQMQTRLTEELRTLERQKNTLELQGEYKE